MNLTHLDNSFFPLTRAQALTLAGKIPLDGFERLAIRERLADVKLFSVQPDGSLKEWTAKASEAKVAIITRTIVGSGSTLALRLHFSPTN